MAQAVGTRLRLDLGDWFLDVTDGMNWRTGVLGNRTTSTRDVLIQARILDTPGVNSIISYSSTFDGNTRRFAVQVVLDTIYGVIPNPATQGVSSTGALFFILDNALLGILDGKTVLD